MQPCSLHVARHRQLHDDQRGAVMVTGLFMATFLIGTLWYLMGIGDAIVFRNRMQEAADHGAFTSAALHAKGMNFIAACNIIMLALVAVHIVLGIIHDFALAACILSLGTGCGGWVNARRIYEGYARFFKPTLTVLHVTEEVAGIGYPWLGAVKAFEIGRGYGNRGKTGDVNVLALSPSMIPNAPIRNQRQEDGSVERRGDRRAGVPLPPGERVGLPVKARRFETLCEKLGNAIYDWTLGNVGLPGLGVVGTVVSNILGGDTVELIVQKIIGAGITFRYCNPLFAGVADGVSNPATAGGVPQGYRDQVRRGQDRISQNNEAAAADNQANRRRPGDPGYRRTVDAPRLDPAGASRGGMWQEFLDPGFDRGWAADGPHVPSSENGLELQKVWAIAANPQYIDDAERRVVIASRQRGTDVPLAGVYYAEAEFYYDCTGRWGDDICNGSTFANDSNAGYSIKWRARLRRLELPNLGQLLVDFTFDAVTADPLYRVPRDILERGPVGAIGAGAIRIFLNGAFRRLDGYLQSQARNALGTPTGIDGAYH